MEVLLELAFLFPAWIFHIKAQHWDLLSYCTFKRLIFWQVVRVGCGYLNVSVTLPQNLRVHSARYIHAYSAYSYTCINIQLADKAVEYLINSCKLLLLRVS